MAKVLVIGMGVSGRAAAEFLSNEGHTVYACDSRWEELAVDPFIQRVDENGPWIDVERVIVSPGVPQSHPLYVQALQRGVEVIGEVELACRSMHSPAIGITGTNGKTTVTMMVAHVLNAARKKAKAVGNVGAPLIAETDQGISVVELSSYQLETMSSKVFDAGVILNVSPDHLDRHGTMENYVLAKSRLGACLKEGAPFFVHKKILEQWGKFFVDYPVQVLESNDNVAAAWALCETFGVAEEAFREAMTSFKKPLHRIEWVGEWRGINFYDDSKGTNVDAVIKAANEVPGPIILIAGGQAKGADFSCWILSFQGKVRTILAIGEAAVQLERELGSQIEVEMCGTLEKAFQRAAEKAISGDCVLLSPGCASFDQFRDYRDRGEQFQQLVRKLSDSD